MSSRVADAIRDSAYPEDSAKLVQEVAELEALALTLAREPKAPFGCRKVPHNGGGYLHDADSDAPYDVDGAMYCGRCHMALSRSGAH